MANSIVRFFNLEDQIRFGFIPWTPAKISTTAWYDASDLSTITALAGAVSQWRDKNGNGNNLSQGTSSKRPTSGLHTLGGNNVIYFDNTFEQEMRGGVGTILDDVAVFSVQTILGFTGGGRDGLYAMDGSSAYFSLESGNAQSFDGFLRTGFGSNIDMTPPSSAYTDVITNMVFDSSTNARAYMNAVERGSAAYSGGLNVNTFELSTDRFNVSYMSCDTAEIIITTDLSTNTRLKMEGYLAWKWGLTANLPIDHPYKSEAPTV